MRVLLAVNHPLARDEVLPALQASPCVRAVRATDLGLSDVGRCDSDLVVVERSLDRFTVVDLDRVTSRCPGAAVVAIALHGARAYSWVRVRRAKDWYVVEETGLGTIERLLEQARLAMGGLVPAA